VAATLESGIVESFHLLSSDFFNVISSDFFCTTEMRLLAGQARSCSTMGTIYKCWILKYVTDVLTQFHWSHWSVLWFV